MRAENIVDFWTPFRWEILDALFYGVEWRDIALTLLLVLLISAIMFFIWRQMFVLAFALGVMLSLNACSLHYPRDQIGFWDQSVTFTGWGFTMATAYGPFNIGYLSWQRNVEKPQAPANPGDVITILPFSTKP